MVGVAGFVRPALVLMLGERVEITRGRLPPKALVTYKQVTGSERGQADTTPVLGELGHVGLSLGSRKVARIYRT